MGLLWNRPLCYLVHILSSLTCCSIILQKQDSSGKFIKPNPVCLMSSLKLPWPFSKFTWVHPAQTTLQCASAQTAQQLPSHQEMAVSQWSCALSVRHTKISRGCTKMKSMCSYPLYSLTIPTPKRAKNLRPTKINRDPPQTSQCPPCVQCVQWKVFAIGAPNKGKLLLG